METPVQLHTIVKEIASRLELVDGRVEMSDGELGKNRARLLRLASPEEKRAVVVSLVALGSKLAREGKDDAKQAIDRLIELATGVLGDATKARALFAGIKPPEKS